MTYTEWEQDNLINRTTLVKRLLADGLITSEIIDYFKFDNMVTNEPSYCGLYTTNTKCHDTDDLNCFFCGCPHFVFNDNGLKQLHNRTLYSSCKINSVKGSEFISDQAIHQDCTNCIIPHRQTFAEINAPKIIKELK